MRVVVWEDKDGWKCASWVRDDDPDEMAPRGVPVCMPDFERIDCNAVKKAINNILVDQNVFTWKDVQRHQTAVTNAVQRALKREIIALYREPELQKRTNGKSE